MTSDPATVERLHRLARHLPTLESPEFAFGDRAPTYRLPDGSQQMPWYELSPDAEAFIRSAGEWVVPFDWSAWTSSAEGRNLIGHPEAVASASVEQLEKLLTTYIRAGRFGDGSLAAAFDSGMLTAIVRRAAVLAKSDSDETDQAGEEVGEPERCIGCGRPLGWDGQPASIEGNAWICGECDAARNFDTFSR